MKTDYSSSVDDVDGLDGDVEGGKYKKIHDSGEMTFEEIKGLVAMCRW